MDDQLWRMEEDAEASTRRERIATAILAAILSNPALCSEHQNINNFRISAVIQADALIAELEKEKE